MRRDYVDDPTAPSANSVVPSVVAAVLREGAVLLVHRRDNDLWALPGGGHDLGEDISATVVREVQEETGYDVVVDRLTGIYTNPHHVMAYDDGEVRQQFSIAFRCTVVGGDARVSDESTAVRWVPLAELASLPMHPSMRLRIAHAVDDGRTEPFIG